METATRDQNKLYICFYFGDEKKDGYSMTPSLLGKTKNREAIDNVKLISFTDYAKR